MSAKEPLNKLAERQQLLVLEADLHRSLIALEREKLRARLAGWRAARARIAVGGPWLAAGSAVAGLLAVRHWRKILRWSPAAITALRWVQSLKGR
jgi:hypothetical protein